MARNHVEAALKRNNTHDPTAHIAAAHARNNGLAPKPTQGSGYVYPSWGVTPKMTAQSEAWKAEDQTRYRSR